MTEVKTETTQEQTKEPSFSEELCSLINKHGIDSKLSVQDYVLAGYMMETIQLIEQINKNKHFFSSLLGGQLMR